MRRELGDDDGEEDQTSAYSSAGNKSAIRDFGAAEAAIVLWRRLPQVHMYALHVRDRELRFAAILLGTMTRDTMIRCDMLCYVSSYVAS